jgi:two-component system chemotaxis response regulator CheB
MAKIRVLVVDDSVVIRQMLYEVLSNHPLIEVIGRASNGHLAITKIMHSNPDLVILDIEMPEMNGLEVLKTIRQTHPKMPIIMFSTLTTLGANATFDALSLGATDYVPKPDVSSLRNTDSAQEWVGRELVPKVVSLGARYAGIDLQKHHGALFKSAAVDIAPRTPRAELPKQRVDAITIGVSTGGPDALATLLGALPQKLPVPILIVQHMPPVFTKLLADRLNAISRLTVVEAEHGQLLEAGKAYIAPGGYHMTVMKSEKFGVFLQLNQDSPENSCRPSVDVLFRSVARTYGGNTLAVILTGMGADGFRGTEMIYEAGGQIIAQDEATSVVWGMPGFVVKSGLADLVLPLPNIAEEIMRRINEKRSLPTP